MANIVLLVEDDKLLGKQINQAFDDAGLEIFWARDSKEAFEALDAQDVGVVLLDIMLQGEYDGYEILRKLKNSEDLKDVPVIMLSNLSQTKDMDKAVELGAEDYLVKANVDLEKVVEMAKKHLRV